MILRHHTASVTNPGGSHGLKRMTAREGTSLRDAAPLAACYYQKALNDPKKLRWLGHYPERPIGIEIDFVNIQSLFLVASREASTLAGKR